MHATLVARRRAHSGCAAHGQIGPPSKRRAESNYSINSTLPRSKEESRCRGAILDTGWIPHLRRRGLCRFYRRCVVWEGLSRQGSRSHSAGSSETHKRTRISKYNIAARPRDSPANRPAGESWKGAGAADQAAYGLLRPDRRHEMHAARRTCPLMRLETDLGVSRRRGIGPQLREEE
jgi:hypothetical protein